MLQAVLNGKASRITLHGQGMSWRELFRTREDLLTAAVFGRFLYLAPMTQFAILDSLLTDEDVSEGRFSKLLEMEFWPKLHASRNSGYVEPDVLIYFENALLIVEVKPPAGGQQKFQQWQDQINAVLAEKYIDGGRQIPDKIHLLALGGGHHEWLADVEKIEREFAYCGLRVHACEWQTFYIAILNVLDEQCAFQGRAVLQDILQVFHLYGINPPRKPFVDILNMLEFSAFDKAISTISAIEYRASPESGLEKNNILWMPLLEISLNISKENSRW